MVWIRNDPTEKAQSSSGKGLRPSTCWGGGVLGDCMAVSYKSDVHTNDGQFGLLGWVEYLSRGRMGRRGVCWIFFLFFPIEIKSWNPGLIVTIIYIDECGRENLGG